jgi:hypothetical protein
MKEENISKLIMKTKRAATWLHKSWAVIGGSLLFLAAIALWWLLVIVPVGFHKFK